MVQSSLAYKVADRSAGLCFSLAVEGASYRMRSPLIDWRSTSNGVHTSMEDLSAVTQGKLGRSLALQ